MGLILIIILLLILFGGGFGYYRGGYYSRGGGYGVGGVLGAGHHYPSDRLAAAWRRVFRSLLNDLSTGLLGLRVSGGLAAAHPAR